MINALLPGDNSMMNIAPGIRAASRDWPSVTVCPESLGWLELMMRGALGPGCEFMGSKECETVFTSGQLPDGTVWPSPVVLPTSEKVAAGLSPGAMLALRDQEGLMLAAMQVREIWRDPRKMNGRPYLAGPITSIQLPTYYSFEKFRPSTEQIRAGFTDAGVAPVAFIASRPIHREAFDALAALARNTGRNILIIGAVPCGTAACDTHPIVRCWLHAVEQANGWMHLSLWPIARSNQSDFLAGTIAANAGCEPVLRETEFPAGTQADREVTELLRQGSPVPESLTFPFVVRELSLLHPKRTEQGLTLFFTGLSGSGKSTIAKAIQEVLLARGGRRVTLLDGDAVRQHLSSELGFSREHRELNVTRIGFVAAEITKHRGLAICAPIAPYEESRSRVRNTIEAYGAFVLVYVSTPLAICEQRDCKGLYAKARCGLIENFTGISDVYEEPVDADIVIDTSESTPREAVELIVSWLESRGYLAAQSC